MKKRVISLLLALALVLGMVPAVTAAPASAAAPNAATSAGYVSDDLVLWLDANNNTGTGTHDPSAKQWVNLANTAQTVDVSKFSWGTDTAYGSYYLNLSNGWIILPDEVRQAIGNSEFTIEFVMDDYDGTPHTNIRNIMNVTGDQAWLDSLSGAVGTPNDNFVLFMNQSGGNNDGLFCFRTCYTNSSKKWSKINTSAGNDYCKVTGTEISGVTNTLTFKSGGSSYWYLDGVQTGSAVNSSKTINVSGFRTNPGTASTWQTTRLPQVTFGTDNSVIASRAPFSAKVKAIRVYKAELTAAEAAQNAQVDLERYYSKPNYEVPKGYVEDGLVLFLDAINNTGAGHSNTAANWVNLANTIGDPATFFAGTGTSYTWNESGLSVNGGVVLPAEALAAAAGSNFTIEFLLDGYDATKLESVTRNLLVLIGPDGTSGVWDDDFVCFQNSTKANSKNAHQFCFDIKKVNPSNSNKRIKYGRISVTASTVNGVTNAITFDHDVQVQWLQNGVAKSTGTDGASADWVTDISLTNGTRLVFGAAPGYMSGKSFAANVKSIRVYNRTLSAAELAQNAAADSSRYMSAETLTELVKDAWGAVITGNPKTDTASGLQSFAQSVMDTTAAEHLNVSVTDNLDGSFTFTYTSKQGVSGYEPQSYTLFVNGTYSVDFSTLSADGQSKFLHDVYTHQGGGAMTLTIADGALVYDLTNGTRPVSGLYLPVVNTTNEYVWEMEIVYQGTGWAGQLFAVKGLEIPQNTCTFNLGSSSKAAAYEFCYRHASDTWSKHVTTTLSAANFGEGKLDASKFNENYSAKSGVTFKLKYVVKDGMAFGYIDDVLVVESANLDADFTGGFGLNTASPDLYVKSINISTDVSNEMVYSPVGHYDVDIYNPQTAIKIAPTIMLQADKDLYNVSGLAKRPASLIFTAKAENGVLNVYDGTTLLGTFEDLYAANAGKAIMGLRITDKAAADLIIAHSATTKNENLWVFSADGALLKYINKSCARIRGVVEISAADLTNIVTDDTVRTAVYDKVYGHGHRTVVIPASAATEDVIRELQSMKLAVIVEGYDLTEAQIYDLVVFGPAGILTDDYAAVISMLESFTDYTLVRPSMVVGHRGDRTYPDNSLESIISAAQSGAAAAEFDVIATLDGYLVLSHDNDNYEAVEYRNGTWAGVKITNAYWKKANAEAAGRPDAYFEGRYFHTSTSQTPVLYATLDQLFDATGTQYPGLTYHIEVKDTQNDTRTGKSGKLVVNLIDELLRSEKYSALRGRCDILCFNTSINYPSTEKGYAVHNQNSKTVTSDMATTLYNYENFYRPINSLLEPGPNVVTPATLEVFKHYGMICCPWTYNNGALYQAYMMGYHGFTTDYPHVSDGIYRKLTASVDGAGNVTVLAYTLADHLGTAPVDVTADAELFAITGGDNVVISGSNVSMKTGVTGTADIGVRYKVNLSSASGSQKFFYLYGGSFQISGVAADKTALQADVDTAKALTAADYTADSWAAVEAALTSAEAVLADNNATQDEIDAAEKALEEAMAALKRPAYAPTATGTYTFTGEEQTVVLAGVESYMTIVSGNKATDAGTHTVTITLADGYAWADGSDGKVQWTIAKADAVITVDTTPITVTYGDELTLPVATTNFGTVTCDKTAADLVNAGTYTVTYTVAGTDNYNEATATLTVTVNKKAAHITVIDKQIMISFPAPDLSRPVAGKDYTVTGLLAGDSVDTVILTCSPDMYTAGAYAIRVSAVDSNYTFTYTHGKLVVVAGSYDPNVGGSVPGGAAVVCNCHKFTDVDVTLWYHPAVCYAVNNGIMNGTGDGTTFSPYMNLSRAMMMTMLARLDGVDTTTGSTWYEVGMKWAVDQGISDGTNPMADITREQLVTMLYRYAGSPVVVGSYLSSYPDADKVSDWAKDAMNWAVATGIIQGKGNGTLDPQGLATRVEVAQIFMNFIKK